MPGAQNGGQRGSCLKLGCLSCGGVTILMAAAMAMGWAAVFSDGGRVSDEHPKLDHELPPDFELVRFAEATETATEARDDPFPRIEEEPLVETTGRVVLEFLRGGLEIVPGEPGDPIRVEGD